MSFEYAEKVFLITGAAGGIGSHLAAMVAGRGAHVVALDLDEDRVKEVVASLPGVNHLAIGLDLTEKSRIQAALDRVHERFGRIDVLVNNAGMTSAERFDERTVESIEHELDVNLVSPLVLTRMAIPLLKASPDPWILSTVSLGGIFPLGETPIYTASKFGLRGAMLSIGLDLSAKGFTVGSILPSATDTPMLWQEAIDGGNSLQFLDPPQTTEDVVRAYERMLDSPRLERYPKVSESWLVRAVMTVPNHIPTLMPLFRGRGDRGLAKYLESLEQRGIARRVGDRWERVVAERMVG